MDDFGITRKDNEIGNYKRAAIYARVSTDRQDEEGTSLISQVQKCLDYCKEHKYIVGDIHIYREVWTGTQYRERPVLSKLRAAARSQEFDALVFYAFDRLSRNQVHQAVIIDELQHNNVSVECVTEQFDDSPVGRFMRSAQSFVSEVEREKIRERSLRGFLQRYNEGKMIGAGPAAYGYKWNKDRTAFEIEPTEAEVIKRIFNLYKGNTSLHQLARILTDEQIPTRTSKEGEPPKGWNLSSINHILKNANYIGEAYGRKWQAIAKSGTTKYLRRPSDEQILLPEGTVPPIIDRETFDIVQAKLTRNREVSARRNMNPEDNLLRCGFIFCGKCGRRMSVQRNKPTKHSPYIQIFYTCKRGGQVTSTECRSVSINVDLIDPYAWSFVSEHLKNHELIKNKIEEIGVALRKLSPAAR
ncbi:recombinase family protein [Dictyobacter kobayashii]|uniref:Recombinase family protein n=1 Tax=Dictyobacter kobayashii TaxID=2014872 RepID=A0A402AF08_9CHLR|nr:recombinase family protein [Dictyobacter kobayashii]GCE17664.1 hypothetical protein KDK_14640 [Dictyobacter kobayashii]